MKSRMHDIPNNAYIRVAGDFLVLRPRRSARVISLVTLGGISEGGAGMLRVSGGERGMGDLEYYNGIVLFPPTALAVFTVPFFMENTLDYCGINIGGFSTQPQVTGPRLTLEFGCCPFTLL